MKKFSQTKLRIFVNSFQIVSNKARQSCLFQVFLGLIKSRKVQFQAIAESMKLEGDTIQVKSIIHRLEDFPRDVVFNDEQVALLLLSSRGSG